jgi:hypothetical protein
MRSLLVRGHMDLAQTEDLLLAKNLEATSSEEDLEVDPSAEVEE